MSQYTETQLPWGMLGPFLVDAKKRVEDQIVALPGTKILSIEITLYPKRETEGPTEEFNLTLGEIGQRFVPDDQIDDDSQQNLKSYISKATNWKTSFFDWLIAVLRAIWLWLLQLLGIRKKNDSIEDSYESTSTNDPVEKILTDIRTELTSWLELDGYAVGVRALVERSPVCIIGLRCEWNWLRLGWYYRRYYQVQTFLGGTACKKSWTSTRC